MGGCTNCKGKDACDDHKGSMMGEVERAMEALYPTRTWGEADEADAARWAGLSLDELSHLADELATELKAATFVKQGGDDEPCDYIYVMCMGRAPCIVQVRDHEAAIPDEWRSAGAEMISELYLRVVISQRTPVAAVQQVALDLVRAPDGFLVREQPRAGVYDAPLLPRMQKLVAILPAYELTHVDFGDIAHAPPGFQGGAWKELYGAAAPAIANYLFYAQPTTMISTTWIPASEGA